MPSLLILTLTKLDSWIFELTLGGISGQILSK